MRTPSLSLLPRLATLSLLSACSSGESDSSRAEIPLAVEPNDNWEEAFGSLTSRCQVRVDRDGDHVCGSEVGEAVVYDLDGPYPWECSRCTGLDCNDEDPNVSVLRRLDADGDGHFTVEPICAAPEIIPMREVLSGDDCDDSDPSLTKLLYRDEDGDGYGVGDGECVSRAQVATDVTANWVPEGDDCDDEDPSVNPSAAWTSDSAESRDCLGFDRQCSRIDASAVYPQGTRFCEGAQLTLAGDAMCNPILGVGCPQPQFEAAPVASRWALRVLNVGSEDFEGDVRVETTESYCAAESLNSAQARYSSVTCPDDWTLRNRVHVFARKLIAGGPPFVISLESVEEPRLLNADQEVCPEARMFPTRHQIICH